MNFNVPCIEITGKESLEIKKRILGISPEDRKKPGINKSTLWYQRKRLVELGKIKVYSKIYSKLT